MVFWIGALLLLQLARLFFLLKSAASYEGFSFWDFSRAFFYGLRFDASALAYLYLAVLALTIVFGLLRVPGRERLVRLFQALGVSFFFMISLIDAEYFVVAHKRLDASILGIAADIQDQSSQFLRNYSYIGFSFFIALFLFWHLSGRKKAVVGSGIWSPVRKLIGIILLVPILILVARGGIQEKPIKISSAVSLGESRLVTLALSTPFVVMQTLKTKNRFVVYRDFPKEQARKILEAGRMSPHSQLLLANRPTDNVVVVLMESFGTEYSFATPFLNSLKDHALSFENHFANGHTSIEAIPAVWAALPSLLPEAYITSRFVGSRLLGIPAMRKGGDREFYFFHGARKGSMYFDSFTSFLGVENYIGKEDFVGDSGAHYDWGVHDHAFFDFTGSRLAKISKPFVASLFSLSSHQPFEIPMSFSSTLAESPTPYIRSLRYADKSLEMFFEKYRNDAWFKKTLFIITGDHSSQCQRSEYCSQLGSLRVPMLIYHGAGKIPPQKVFKITQHADIAATVADYLALDSSPLLPFGGSTLRAKAPGLAVFRVRDEFQLVSDEGFFRLNGDEFFRCDVKGPNESNCALADPVKYSAAYDYLRATRSYFTQSLDQRSFY